MDKCAIKLMGFNARGFWLLEKPNLQLSFESVTSHLGDHTGSVRDPSDAQHHDLR
jgi:hypothetical protein